MIHSQSKVVSEELATRLDPHEYAEYKEAMTPPPSVIKACIRSGRADDETCTIKFIDAAGISNSEKAFSTAAGALDIAETALDYVWVDGKYFFPENSEQTTVDAVGSIAAPGDLIVL